MLWETNLYSTPPPEQNIKKAWMTFQRGGNWKTSYRDLKMSNCLATPIRLTFIPPTNQNAKKQKLFIL